MHWLPLVAMVIASALPFPHSPIPRLVSAATEPRRSPYNHGNGISDRKKDSNTDISNTAHRRSTTSLTTDSMDEREILVDYSSQSSLHEDYIQTGEVKEQTHVDYRTPSALDHVEHQSQGFQEHTTHLVNSDPCNHTQNNTSTEDTRPSQGQLGLPHLEDYSPQGNDSQVIDISLGYHSPEDYKSQKRVSIESKNFVENHFPFKTRKEKGKVIDISVRRNYNSYWDLTGGKPLPPVGRTQGEPLHPPEEQMGVETEGKEEGRGGGWAGPEEDLGGGWAGPEERLEVGLGEDKGGEWAGLETGGGDGWTGRELGLKAGGRDGGAGLEAGGGDGWAGLEAGLETGGGKLLKDAELRFLDAHPRVLFTPSSSPPKHPPLLLMLEAGLPATDADTDEGRDEVGGALAGVQGAELRPKSRPKRASPAYDRRGERSVCEVANEWVTDKKTAIDILGNTVTVLPEIQTPRGPLKQYFFETKCRPPDTRGTGGSGVSGRDCVGVDKKHWVSECKAKQSYVRALTTHPQKGVGWRWIRINSSCVCVLQARVPRS